MRRLRVESTTDDELAQSYSELLQPANLYGCTVTVAARPQVREDGAIERTEPVEETFSTAVISEETRQNRANYSYRLEQYKRDEPSFAAKAANVDPNAQLPLAAIDAITRMQNGPQIADFLRQAPEVREALCQLDPLEAVRKIEEMADDLDFSRMDQLDYQVWKHLRNRQESSRHKPQKRQGRMS